MSKINTVKVNYCDWNNYSLLDSGNGQKLERWGDITIVRSEPKAWWKPILSQKDWGKAHAQHDELQKKWIFKQKLPLEWSLDVEGIKVWAKFFNTSKHLGIFPEQMPNWRWMQKNIGQDCSVLSLFGYTGIASLLAAKSGAKVTHVDASKPAILWAKANQALSGLDNKPIRWILDDAQKFVHREIRRGKTYDAIILDPPSFGRGPNKEPWKIETDLVPLLESCRSLLSDKASFIILTLYALEASSLMISNLLQGMTKGLKGQIELGELAHKQAGDSNIILPLSLYGTWKALP